MIGDTNASFGGVSRHFTCAAVAPQETSAVLDGNDDESAIMPESQKKSRKIMESAIAWTIG